MTKHGQAKTASQRQLRVGEELRHALARILTRGELRDPALQDIALTVTEVRISPDLRQATAYVVPLGGAGMSGAVDALNRAAGYFRGQLAREVKLRNAPRIVFQADLSFDKAQHIEKLLRHPRVLDDLQDHEDLIADSGEPADDGGITERDGNGHGA